MILKKVDHKEFLKQKNYYFDQIPKAQNSNPNFSQDVFDYYQTNLKQNDQNFMMTAQENGEMIGCAFFVFYPQESKFFVVNINTKKDFQHTDKKVATNVVKEGLKEFFKIHNKIFLWVHKENTIAIKLYEKLGFKKTDYYPKNLKFLAGEENILIIMELEKSEFDKKEWKQ